MSRSALFLPMTTATMLGVGAIAAAAQDNSDLEARVSQRLEAARAELIEIRRDLHRHPELSGQEERTAGVIAERLRQLGLEVRTGIGGHGVVGWLTGDKSGPVVAFRADMDAVRSAADDPVEFRSVTPGVRHICGHDVHTTIGLALAEGLSAVREELAGSVMLIFQPAEESATGARAMLADGIFEDEKPSAIFAYHTTPMQVGQLATAHEALMPGRDRVQVTVTGTGDLESAAAEVRRRIQAVGTVSPEQATSPTTPDFVFVQIGRPRRVSSDTFTVTATITTAVQAMGPVEEQLSDLSFDGVTVELDYRERVIAGVTNDPELARRAIATAAATTGVDTVFMVESMAPAFSEDFGSFQDSVPGVMFFLGVSNAEKGWVGMPHSPGYVADEEAIFVGARAMAAVLLDLLRSP